MRPQVRSCNMMFNGVPVKIGQRAEIDGELYMVYPDLVQAALDDFGPMSGDPDDALTLVLEDGDPRVYATVVKVEPSDDVLYAFHAEQTSSLKQPVPFVRRDAVEEVDSISLHMAGSPDSPVIVRLYTGDYRPGLPWQKSVRWNPRLLDESIAYWKEHAFVLQPHVVIGKLESWPPLWVGNFALFLSRDQHQRNAQRARTARR